MIIWSIGGSLFSCFDLSGQPGAEGGNCRFLLGYRRHYVSCSNMGRLFNQLTLFNRFVFLD
jgi:hypothetical protein